MAALNYYIGLKRGAQRNIGIVSAGVASVGTAADVEVRMQLNDGSTATGLTRKDVNLLLETLLLFVNSSGINHAGANLPPL